MKIHFIKIISLLLVLTGTLFADYAGGYPGAILRLGVSAREISLAGSTAAGYEDAFSAFSNPAMISRKNGITIGSSFILLSNNISMQAFSIGRELPPNAGASLSIVHAGVSNIVGVDQNEQFLGSLKYDDSYAMITFGIDFSKYLSIGLNAKTLFQRYAISSNESISSDGISLDAGLISSPFKRIDLGIKINNLYGYYKFEESRQNIPMQIIIGCSYSATDNMLILAQHEMTDIDSKYWAHRSSLGSEYKLNMDKSMFLRLGIKQTKWAVINSEPKKDMYKLMGGVGIEFESFNKSTLNIDYAIEFNHLGISNMISLGTKL